jgi:predicted lipoprotein with Yx(FWY)xxD motif
VALIKRSVIVAGAGALAALTACAPAGYNASGSGATPPPADQQPVANAAAAPSAAPAPEQSDPAAAEPPKDVKLTEQLVSKSLPRMGKVVTDEKGWVLYRFDKDSANPPTTNCVDDCAKIWPPALTDGTPQLEGVDPDKVGTVTRPDGTRQITIGGWAVYRYVGDKQPGQWKGQGVGGTWFVVAPDGKKNLTCLPTGTPKPVAPPADSSGDSSGSYGGGSSY